MHDDTGSASPISAARLSELVGLIYDCAIEPARWPIAMDAIRIELDLHNATLDLMLLPSGTLLSNVACNIPPHYHAMIADSGLAVIEQWGGPEIALSLPMDQPAVLSHANPAFDVATSTNAYYVAFAKPQGIIDVLAIGLARDARAIGTLAFGRHESAGPIGGREIAIAHLLVPHLQRAATINRMLEGAASAQAGFIATLDQLTVPIVLLDGDLRILHANAAGRTLIEAQSLIRARDGQLEATAPGITGAIANAVAQAERDEGALGRRGLGIPVIGPDGVAGALHVLPLNRRLMKHSAGAIAALFVAEFDAPFVAPTEMAAALFALTPAEARVFEHVVSGLTLADIAAMLDIRLTTVKTHLSRLYDKVGVRRQADLVRVAASLAIPAAI